MPAPQTLHARLVYPAEHPEALRPPDRALVGLAVLPQLPRLAVLHAFHEVTQELVGVLLAAEFKLRGRGRTFLKMLFRWWTILLGE